MKRFILFLFVFGFFVTAYGVEKNPASGKVDVTVILEAKGYAVAIEHSAYTEIQCTGKEGICYTCFLFPDGTYEIDYNVGDECKTVITSTRPEESIDPETGNTILKIVK